MLYGYIAVRPSSCQHKIELRRRALGRRGMPVHIICSLASSVWRDAIAFTRLPLATSSFELNFGRDIVSLPSLRRICIWNVPNKQNKTKEKKKYTSGYAGSFSLFVHQPQGRPVYVLCSRMQQAR